MIKGSNICFSRIVVKCIQSTKQVPCVSKSYGNNASNQCINFGLFYKSNVIAIPM